MRDIGDRARPPAWVPHSVPVEPVRFALLAESAAGYQNLCRMITGYKLREVRRRKALRLWPTYRALCWIDLPYRR